jgi:hypothetical protein
VMYKTVRVFCFDQFYFPYTTGSNLTFFFRATRTYIRTRKLKLTTPNQKRSCISYSCVNSCEIARNIET